MKYRRRRRIETDTTSSSNMGQMMNLSLFIMLLAFFIVLNSISSYEEEKTSKVQRSVTETFAVSPRQEDAAPSVTPDELKSINEGDAFERLEKLFTAQIISYEVLPTKAKGTMQVKIPYDEFSKAMGALDQVDLTKQPTRAERRGNFLLPTLVSVLTANIDGAPTRLEIYLNVDDNPAELQSENPDSMKDVIERVSVFSKALEEKGMPQKLLNIGISKGDPEYVNLIFKKYIAFSPVTGSNP